MNNLKKTDNYFISNIALSDLLYDIWYMLNDILDTFVYFLCEYFKLPWESIWKYLSSWSEFWRNYLCVLLIYGVFS